MAIISSSPVRSPLSRRNSSAEITTTSSRPWTVTCCGPSLRTRRTNSLKRALASCRTQWPGVLLNDLGGRGESECVNLVMLTILYNTAANDNLKEVDCFTPLPCIGARCRSKIHYCRFRSYLIKNDNTQTLLAHIIGIL